MISFRQADILDALKSKRYSFTYVKNSNDFWIIEDPSTVPSDVYHALPTFTGSFVNDFVVNNLKRVGYEIVDSYDMPDRKDGKLFDAKGNSYVKHFYRIKKT